MGRDQSRFGYILLALLLVTVGALFFARSISAQPVEVAETVSDDIALVEVETLVDRCQVSVHIQGEGLVTTQVSNAELVEFTSAANELQAACNEVIELTAKPDPQWRFVSWQGVPEEMQRKSTIAVSSPANVTAVFTRREILRFESLEVPYFDRGGRLVTEVPIYEPSRRPLSGIAEVDPSPPTIELWYGDAQSFGQWGTPQEWLNILGNVSDPDGDLQTLEYSLNGSPASPLTYGGDGTRSDSRRNYREGDFNIDISTAHAYLNNGSNTVVISATDLLATTTSFVTLNYDSSNVWPLPYGINWGGASSIQDVAQVVDGKWSYSSAGVRPVETGYDRIIALGDMAWSDFELTVPITVHGYDLDGFSPQQVVPALAISMRWQGHTTTPDLCDQPLCGYYPVGANAWYAFDADKSGDGQFSMWAKASNKTDDTSGLSLTWGETYYWKVRSQTVQGTRGRYKMKVWPADEAEPDSWLVSMDGAYDSLLNGSALLVSHHVDVTFGDVIVVPIITGEGPPNISEVRVIPEPYGATIFFSTDEPATSRIDYGTTSTYGSSVTAAGLNTEHSLYLPDLDPQRNYHFKITATDASAESSSTADDVFSTQELIALVSDDFNTCTLDEDWFFVNPLDDSSYELNGIQALISVPAGTNHDIYPSPGLPTNRAPRLMRAVTDPNNLKVKFDSGVGVDRELQGILVEQDAQNFLRINYQYQNGQLKLYVIGFRTGTSPKILKNITVNELWKDGPLYLLLTRQDGQWQIGYSNTGQSWSQVGLFTFPLSVTQAGFFAGNFNTTPGNEPAFTTVVDYYFDANVPVVPEDADPLMLPVNVIGNGSVSKDRTCGNPVQLTAEPDSGWHFVEWQGAPIDGNSSLVVTTPFSFGDEVTALFEIGEPQMYSLDVQTSGQGTVTQVPDKTEYLAGEAVALTAVPGEGWLFDSWSVDLSGTDPEQTITMDSDKTVVAKFVQDIVSLDIEVEGPGHVQITPQGPYQNGDKVTLMAVPDGKLSTFVGWSGDRVSEDNPLKLTMTEDLSLTATFIIYKQFLPFTLSPFSE